MDNSEFAKRLSFYGDWISSAYASGDLKECRSRCEAVIDWLDQVQAVADQAQALIIRGAKSDMMKMVASYPPPSHRPSLPEIPRESTLNRWHMTPDFRRQMLTLSPREREPFEYILSAGLGQSTPNPERDSADLFVAFYWQFARAVARSDSEGVSHFSKMVLQWSEVAPLNPSHPRPKVTSRVRIVLGLDDDDSDEDNNKPPPHDNPKPPFALRLANTKKRFLMGPYPQRFLKGLEDMMNEMERTRIID